MASTIQSQLSSVQCEPPDTAIIPNTIYVTFNVPQTDEYHRSILVTHSSLAKDNKIGTLFHAIYDKQGGWRCETRTIRNLAHSKTLTLLYRIACLSLDSNATSLNEEATKWFETCHRILTNIPMSASIARQDDLLARLGHPDLEGYSCVIWSIDAVAALAQAGMVDLKGQGAEEFLMTARELAGPSDGRSVVGVDHGPVRVVHDC